MLKAKIDKELSAELRGRLRMIGWTLAEWMAWGELELSVAVLRKILNGEPHREDEVYAVEWCISRFVKSMDDGSLAVNSGGEGRTYLRTAHVQAHLRDNKLTITMYGDDKWTGGNGLEDLENELLQVIQWMGFEPWKYPKKGQ